jgi:hypothetical protein
MPPGNKKKDRGQFFTTRSSYILDGLPLPLTLKGIRCIIEPFAGKGDLVEWVKEKWGVSPPVVEAYDIEPNQPYIQARDSLKHPPDYKDAWILTNPPYLARNKCAQKDVYDMYGTNDLYKCFLMSVVRQGNCRGGMFILPAGFFFSPRDLDVRCRHEFLSRYRILKIKYFEEPVFDDTTTTVVAFAFEASETALETQHVQWEMMPSGTHKTFFLSSTNHWIVGGNVYTLPVPDNGVRIRRYVVGMTLKENEMLTSMTLHALDSGTQEGRIHLAYKKGYTYPAKESSRTYATLCLTGKTLSDKEQETLCGEFNAFLEQKRNETWSLFLPQYRESKEYARKRIPFELAYRIVLHILFR